jgi:hypothetical protein
MTRKTPAISRTESPVIKTQETNTRINDDPMCDSWQQTRASNDVNDYSKRDACPSLINLDQKCCLGLDLRDVADTLPLVSGIDRTIKQKYLDDWIRSVIALLDVASQHLACVPESARLTQYRYFKSACGEPDRPLWDGRIIDAALPPL